MGKKTMESRAEFSPCGRYRYRLERQVSHDPGPTVAFFGVNPSTATAAKEDATTRRWRGFAQRLGARRYLAGNAFAYRSTDVNQLMLAFDPMGADNADHLRAIIAEADILIPCWGSRNKLPVRLHADVDWLARSLTESGKPVYCFGRTKGGDPLHPLFVPYSQPLMEFSL